MMSDSKRTVADKKVTWHRISRLEARASIRVNAQAGAQDRKGYIAQGKMTRPV